MALDADRQRQLHAIKLATLARENLGHELEDITATADGAIGSAGPTLVALAQERCDRALGPALVAARRRSCTEVVVLASDDAGVLARRARLFTVPITVWGIDGRELVSSTPGPYPRPDPQPDAYEQVALLAAADLDVVVEHGVIVGEVQGLEIARIVTDELGTRLEVGVGRHDREAFGIIHGDLPTTEALELVVAAARRHRRPGADPHPLNRLGAERWLRRRLTEHPHRVGAEYLDVAPPPVRRENLKVPVPAVAVGRRVGGGDVVVVVSVGIDLDVVPFAADARHQLEPDAHLVVAVPERDAHAVTRDLADVLAVPGEVVAIDDRWREWDSAASVA